MSLFHRTFSLFSNTASLIVGSVVQPICLAPSQKAESGFNDIDCHSATRDNPFPHFLLDQGKERRVCSSGEPGSRITGFHGGSRCESNGIGDAEAGQMCATECTDDYTVINNDAKVGIIT